jgi:TPR repeat protein
MISTYLFAAAIAVMPLPAGALPSQIKCVHADAKFVKEYRDVYADVIRGISFAKDIEQDFERYISVLEKAAERQCNRAAATLSFVSIMRAGIGSMSKSNEDKAKVPREQQRALKYAEMATKIDEGWFELAILLDQGNERRKNSRRALDAYTKAAIRLDDSRATRALAEIYRKGRLGVTADMSKADEWDRKSEFAEERERQRAVQLELELGEKKM